MSGVIPGNGNSIFTVTYLIDYQLRTTGALLVSTRVISNGVPVPGLVDSPAGTRNSWSASAIVSLNAGDTLSLQLFGLLGAITLDGPSGANLTIVQVG